MNKTTNLIFDLRVKSKNIFISVEEVDVPQSSISRAYTGMSKAKKDLLKHLGFSIPSNNVIIKNNKSTVSKRVLNVKKANEVSIFSISAITPFNKDVTVAKISISSVDGKRIINKPSLSLKSSITDSQLINKLKFKLVTTSTVKDSNGIITGYNMNVVYRSPQQISSDRDLKLDLRINSLKKITPVKSINKINVGRSHVKTMGEDREIKIYGSAGTNFTLTATDSDSVSILGGIANSEVTSDTGIVNSCITDVIPPTGFYTIKLTFPEIPTIRSTAVNGSMAASGATKVIFDDLTDVKVGDQLFSTAIDNKSIKVIELDPDGNNANECNLSQELTAADDTVVVFKTPTTYSINVTTTDTLSSNLPTTKPMFTLNQFADPLLTIRVTTDSRLYSINSQAIPGSGSQTFDVYYTGRALEQNKTLDKVIFPSKFNKSLVLDRTDSGALAVTKTPNFESVVIFPKTTVQNSDWTNTDPLVNGGTRVSINHAAPVLSTADGVSNNACTVSYVLNILEWGNADVIMELDLDNIIST